jgi:hypothetical protein
MNEQKAIVCFDWNDYRQGIIVGELSTTGNVMKQDPVEKAKKAKEYYQNNPDKFATKNFGAKGFNRKINRDHESNQESTGK